MLVSRPRSRRSDPSFLVAMSSDSSYGSSQLFKTIVEVGDIFAKDSVGVDDLARFFE